MSKSYLDQCVDGDASLGEIDRFVAQWHNDKTITAPLSEFLGFSWKEYKLWAERPEALIYIVFAHKNNIPLMKALKQKAAAKGSATCSDASDLMEWLKKTTPRVRASKQSLSR